MKAISFLILFIIANVVLIGAYFSLKASFSNNSNFSYVGTLIERLKENNSETLSFQNPEPLVSVATATSTTTKVTYPSSVPVKVTQKTPVKPATSTDSIKITVTQQNPITNFTDSVHQKKEEFGVWLWRSPRDMSSDEMSAVVDQISASGFTSVYITIDDYLDIRSQKKAVEKYESSLRTFLVLAAKKNIAVDVEAGGKRWAFPAERAKASTILSFASEFNKKNVNKIRAVQYDIEPYDLAGYENKKEAYLSDFLTLISQLALQAKQENIALSIAIPEFYDSRDEAGSVHFEDRVDLPFGHLLRILGTVPKSSLIVMAYSDRTDGPLGSINISQTEVAQASYVSNPVKIIIAQETGNVDSEGRETLSPSVTFHGQSKTYFFSQLKIIDDTFSAYPAYGGIAVHYFDTFLFLKDK